MDIITQSLFNWLTMLIFSEEKVRIWVYVKLVLYSRSI